MSFLFKGGDFQVPCSLSANTGPYPFVAAETSIREDIDILLCSMNKLSKIRHTLSEIQGNLDLDISEYSDIISYIYM